MQKSSSRAVFVILAFLFAAPAAPAAFSSDTTVKIDSGFVEGVESGGVVSFKGIPYAAPPVGDLRWKAPQPVKPWEGVRKASAYGNDCVQLPIPGDAGASGSTRGEDCLVLNVWTPAGNRKGEKLPVLVWIHGGGFLNGAASVPFFDGGSFAREGVILVSMNYRLGRLGFFAHPALSAEKDGPTGNYAFLDQLAALKWVKRNVGAFGGDPARVTVTGESAGGISVVQLLTWPDARGLFQRAAVLSGGGRTYLVLNRKLKEAAGPLPSAEDSGIAFAQSVGITDTGKAGLAALRALPAEKVNGDMSMAALLTRPPGYAGGPVTEGDVVTEIPEQNFLKGNFARVPLIVGTTSADLPGDLPPDPSKPLDFFGEDGERAGRLYDPNGVLPPNVLALAISVDMTMHEPARFLATEMTEGGAPAWLYRFGYVADSLRPEVTGAAHASELGYLFNQLDARYGQDVSDKDRDMARTFHSYFVNFAKTGNPNGPGLPEWPKFYPPADGIMVFTPEGGAEFEPDPLKERLDLVEEAVGRMRPPGTQE